MFKKISDKTIQAAKESSVLNVAKALLPDLKHKGKEHRCKCPKCDHDSFSIPDNKNLYKCFSCEWGGNNPIGLYMDVKELNTDEYPQAVRAVCELNNITVELEETEHTPPPKPKAPKAKPAKLDNWAFTDKQLADSGLTRDDLKFELVLNDGANGSTTIYRMHPGEVVKTDSYNIRWDVDGQGSDMILRFIDLDGTPVQFYPTKGPRKETPFLRVRYRLPEQHKNKDDKPTKYTQPYQSGTHLWLTSDLIRAYQSGRQFETLHITEGEKKAERLAKSDMPAIGITGIHNFLQGNNIPSDVLKVIEKCGVKNVVIHFDSDLFDLPEKGNVMTRAKSFASAANKIQEHIYALNNTGYHVEVYLAHPLPQHDQKGVDDLIVNTLANKGDTFRNDLQKNLGAGTSTGDYVTTYKITGFTKFQIQEIWHCHNLDSFLDHYREQLIERDRFSIGVVEYKLSDETGKFEPINPINPEEQFWKEGKRGYEWSYDRFKRFAYNRGYGIFFDNNHRKLVCVGKDRLVSPSDWNDLWRFGEQWLRTTGNEALIELWSKTAPSTLLEPKQLETLPYVDIAMTAGDRDTQYLYFKNTYWRITPKGIEAEPINRMTGYIWADRVLHYEPEVIDVPGKIGTADFVHDFAQWARDNTDFGRYLWNSSNFYWRQYLQGDETPEKGHRQLRNLTPLTTICETEELHYTEQLQHFMSKCSAFGYLLTNYQNPVCAKAIVLMDGTISDIGDSNGRSGKSLFFKVMEAIKNVVLINGKNRRVEEDKYKYEEVSPDTDVVYFDDVFRQFNLEGLFSDITNGIVVEKKGLGKITIPFADSPKIGITTNHAIDTTSGSAADRVHEIAFSDYYSGEYRPYHESGRYFVNDWDADEFSRFLTFAGHCIALYFREGLISPPQTNIVRRQAIQTMGHTFLSWAETYLSNDKLGQRLDRKDMYASLLERSDLSPNDRKWLTPQGFKTKLKAYCKYAGLLLNGHLAKGQYDKVNGVEFFTITRKDGTTPPTETDQFNEQNDF